MKSLVTGVSFVLVFLSCTLMANAQNWQQWNLPAKTTQQRQSTQTAKQWGQPVQKVQPQRQTSHRTHQQDRQQTAWVVPAARGAVAVGVRAWNSPAGKAARDYYNKQWNAPESVKTRMSISQRNQAWRDMERRGEERARSRQMDRMATRAVPGQSPSLRSQLGAQPRVDPRSFPGYKSTQREPAGNRGVRSSDRGTRGSGSKRDSSPRESRSWRDDVYDRDRHRQ